MTNLRGIFVAYLYILVFYNQESETAMEKVRKYTSFKTMKDAATSGTVSTAVLAERHKRFESFMDFLRGDTPPEKSHPKAVRQ